VIQLKSSVYPLISAEGGDQIPGSQRILIVDDDIDVAQLLAMLLRDANYDVEFVENGQAALESVQSCPPDIVLLDIGLKGMDGYEVARRVRALPRRKKMLLVALTGHGQEDDRQQALEAGFDSHVTKPVSLETLEEAFSLLGRP